MKKLKYSIFKKSLRTSIIVSLFIFTTSSLFAQKEGNNWYFGNNAGIDFNSGTATLITSNAGSAADYMGAVSDANGDILFYSNGVTVWNKNNNIMTNGNGLHGTISSGQSPLIVPQPNSNLYYIFTLDQWANSNGLKISLVDMSLQNGLGAVTIKNNSVYTNATEKITSYYNVNGNYYWIITHSFLTNEFRVYKLDDSGLLLLPVVSYTGSIYSGNAGQFNDAVGQLNISDDGSKLVSACYQSGFFEIYDFDFNTGIVSNPRLISGYPNAFGAEFSPDGSKLYVSRWVTSNNIWQYDLNAGNWNNVLNSAILIGSGNTVGYMQLAPDGKIYSANYTFSTLGVISNPNNSGMACNYSATGFNLSPKSSGAGLCNTVKKKSPTAVAENNKVIQAIAIYPNPSAGQVNIRINNLNNQSAFLKIVNSKGEIIRDGLKYNSNGGLVLDGLSPDIYCIYSSSANGEIASQKFIVTSK